MNYYVSALSPLFLKLVVSSHINTNCSSRGIRCGKPILCNNEVPKHGELYRVIRQKVANAACNVLAECVKHYGLDKRIQT